MKKKLAALLLLLAAAKAPAQTYTWYCNWTTPPLEYCQYPVSGGSFTNSSEYVPTTLAASVGWSIRVYSKERMHTNGVWRKLKKP